MGYTHYFGWKVSEHLIRPRKRAPKELQEFEGTQAVAEDLAPLILNGEQAGVLAGPQGWGRPNLSPPSFNGLGDQGFETFDPLDDWSVYEAGDLISSFCKTEGRPYDSYVVAALLRLKAIFGSQINLTTDGRWQQLEEGHLDAGSSPIKLYREVFGIEPPDPSRVFESHEKDPTVRYPRD